MALLDSFTYTVLPKYTKSTAVHRNYGHHLETDSSILHFSGTANFILKCDR